MKTACGWIAMCVAAGVMIGGMAAVGQDAEEGAMPPPGPGGTMAGRGGMAQGGGSGMHGKKAGYIQEPGMNEEGMVEQLLNKSEVTALLGLTDEQIAILKKAVGELKMQQKTLWVEREKAGLEQARLMLETNINEEAVMAAVEKAGKAQIDLAKSRVRQLLLLRKTLTPEQIDKMKELIQQRNRKMQEEFEKGKRGMGGQGMKGFKRPDRGPGGRGGDTNRPAMLRPPPDESE